MLQDDDNGEGNRQGIERYCTDDHVQAIAQQLSKLTDMLHDLGHADGDNVVVSMPEIYVCNHGMFSNHVLERSRSYR